MTNSQHQIFWALSEAGLQDAGFLPIEIHTLIENSGEVNYLGSQFLCLQHVILCMKRKIFEVKRESVRKRVYKILLILIPQEAKQ